MSAANITLQPAIRGDKWQGIAAIGPVLISGAPPAFPLTRIRMQFRRFGRVGMTFDTVPGENSYPIQISNPATWLAHIPEVSPLPLEVGGWTWDMEFWQGSDAAPQTLYAGTLTVLADQTR